jgi:hypothetical protein
MDAPATHPKEINTDIAMAIALAPHSVPVQLHTQAFRIIDGHSLDVLPALSLRLPRKRGKDGDSYCAKQEQAPVQSLQRVPASQSGLAAPSLHRLTRHVLPLGCYMLH